jgi:hypothetical protein
MTMATSSTHKLMQIIQEGQVRAQESQDRMLEYLRRADEHGERQSRATLKALAAIQEGQKVLHDGQKVLAQMLGDMQAITGRSLELMREIHEAVLDKKSSRH